LSEITRRGLIGAGLSGAVLAVVASDRTAQAVEAGTGYVPVDTLVVNVMDHGAKGDGVTDDTAAIQATINGSPAGSTIFFPGGRTYLVSAPVRLLGDRAYVGGGWHLSNAGAIIKQKSGANMIASGASPVTGLFVDNGW
jgi:polygalacturonase